MENGPIWGLPLLTLYPLSLPLYPLLRKINIKVYQ